MAEVSRNVTEIIRIIENGLGEAEAAADKEAARAKYDTPGAKYAFLSGWYRASLERALGYARSEAKRQAAETGDE